MGRTTRSAQPPKPTNTSKQMAPANTSNANSNKHQQATTVQHSQRKSIEKKRRASSKCRPQDQPRESMPVVHLNKAKGTKAGIGLTSYTEARKVVVDSLKPGSKLKGSVAAGDILHSVNGIEVFTAAQATELIVAA